MRRRALAQRSALTLVELEGATGAGGEAPRRGGCLGRARPRATAILARPHQLDQAERPDHLLERLDLVLAPGDPTVTLRFDTSTTPARKISANCITCARASPSWQEIRRARAWRDRLARLQVADLDHVDELQLLRHLIDRMRGAVERQRDPRDRRQRRPAPLYFEARPVAREQSGDAGEDTKACSPRIERTLCVQCGCRRSPPGPRD